MNKIEKEAKRLEQEMLNCKCGNGLTPVLGECHLCDVRFAKHSGITETLTLVGEEVKEWYYKDEGFKDYNGWDLDLLLRRLGLVEV